MTYRNQLMPGKDNANTQVYLRVEITAIYQGLGEGVLLIRGNKPIALNYLICKDRIRVAKGDC